MQREQWRAMRLMQHPSVLTFCLPTLLVSVVMLILAVAWATTGASAQGACETQGDLRPQLGAPAATALGSWSSSDCKALWREDSWLDRYRLYISEPTLVTIDLTSRVDTWLRLVGTDGYVFGSNDDVYFPDNLNSQISCVPLGVGTYYAEASTFQPQATGSYTLSVNIFILETFRPFPGIFQPSTSDRDVSLSPSDCRDPYDSADYADIYSFELDAKSDVIIDLESTAFIPFVRLLDDRGAEIERDNDGGEQRDGIARIDGTLSSGVYHIVATDFSWGRGEGSYELRINASKRFDDSVDGPCPEPDSNNQWTGGLEGHQLSPDSPAVHDVKKLIARVLFLIRSDLNVVHCVDADYNDFGEYGPSYKGGHAGWDVQTTNVGEGATANVPFYSLTAGKVVYPPDSSLRTPYGAWGAIGVDDGENTVYYLHARHIYVYEGQQVEVGEPLGIQGDTGVSGAEHVHIEVHRNQERPPHNFDGAVNARWRGGTNSLLLWHEQLNYLCKESADSWLRLNSERCPPLDETNAPSLRP